MHVIAGDLGTHFITALVPGDQLHSGRFADNDDIRPIGFAGHVFQQHRHAEPADLLIIGKGDMDRFLETCRHECRHGTENTGQEAFHVHRSAAMQSIVPSGQCKWIAVPFLSRDRHHVGMAVEDDAAVDLRPDGRKHVCPLPRFIEAQRGFDAAIGQDILYVADDVAIRFSGNAVEANQAFEDFNRVFQPVRHVQLPPKHIACKPAGNDIGDLPPGDSIAALAAVP